MYIILYYILNTFSLLGFKGEIINFKLKFCSEDWKHYCCLSFVLLILLWQACHWWIGWILKAPIWLINSPCSWLDFEFQLLFTNLINYALARLWKWLIKLFSNHQSSCWTFLDDFLYGNVSELTAWLKEKLVTVQVLQYFSISYFQARSKIWIIYSWQSMACFYTFSSDCWFLCSSLQNQLYRCYVLIEDLSISCFSR